MVGEVLTSCTEVGSKENENILKCLLGNRIGFGYLDLKAYHVRTGRKYQRLIFFFWYLGVDIHIFVCMI